MRSLTGDNVARNSNHLRNRSKSRKHFKRYQELPNRYCFYRTNFGNKAKKCATPYLFRTKNQNADRLINRMLLANSSSKITFLIDTAADISVIQKSFAPHAKVQQELTLYAANGTKMPTYGTKRILLDLGLRR
ncbi:hypothetical protein TNCV_3343941 [Trichonephila clavipes]|nr:hypothetical protein TNCV_3343941 [Trichonephila clavipes]